MNLVGTTEKWMLEKMLNLVCICLKVEYAWIKHERCLEMQGVLVYVDFQGNVWLVSSVCYTGKKLDNTFSKVAPWYSVITAMTRDPAAPTCQAFGLIYTPKTTVTSIWLRNCTLSSCFAFLKEVKNTRVEIWRWLEWIYGSFVRK